MNGDKPVARLVNNMTYPMMRAYDGVEQIELPFSLFGFGKYSKREVEYATFLKWAEERCFPPERVDADEALASLGLKRYDAYEIIKRTNAVLSYVDNFWVDFGSGRLMGDNIITLEELNDFKVW